MKKQFEKAVIESTEIRALFVLGVVLVLRAWRALPHLRPHQLLFPITFMQIIVFVISALDPTQFLQTFAVGNLVIVAIGVFPMTLQKVKE
jgi:hypothetical protein